MPHGTQHNGDADMFRRRRQAAAHLRQADARLAAIIDRVGSYELTLTRNPFCALVGSIVQQQVSMSAGAAIQRRLRALCPHGRITPGALLSLKEGELRGAGLSRQKVGYVRNVAEAFSTRTLTAARLRRMSDDEVIAATTALKGVGRWTAEMLLIFCLDRPDVWPVDDFGVKAAVRRFLNLEELPKRQVLLDLAEPWRPHRTCAAWYLWRSLEGPVAPGITP